MELSISSADTLAAIISNWLLVMPQGTLLGTVDVCPLLDVKAVIFSLKTCKSLIPKSLVPPVFELVRHF